MTKPQRITLMAEWWPAACRAQGWDDQDRDLRLRILSQAVKRPLATASDLNNRGDIDAVKAHLKALTDNIDAAQETGDPTIGEARRLRNVIMQTIRPCLALYEKENTMGYIQTIIEALVRWNRTDRPTRPPTLDDLDCKPTFHRHPPCYALKEGPSQLHQAMMTLNARLHAKRKAAGHTIHEMNLAAGIHCNCSACCKNRIAQRSGSSAESRTLVPTTDEDPNPF